jgi:competence ComEA-like helix-hairpin-helix protein
LSKKSTTSTIDKELLIFITPHVIDNTIQAEQISKNIKDEYSDIVYRNFYINTADKDKIAALYLNNIYNKLLSLYFDEQRRMGKSDYYIKKSLPEWLNKDNASKFADALAQSIVSFRETQGPIINYEDLKNIKFQFMNSSIDMSAKQLGELYNEIVSNVDLNVNMNLVTVEELSNLKNFDYQTAYKIVNIRKQIGYFKNKHQIRYFILKNDISENYYNDKLSKIFVTGDLKTNEFTEYDYLYKIENNEQSFDENSSTDKIQKLNLNTANAQQIQEVLGLPMLESMLIVKYRERNGNYTSINDLNQISGISKYINRIRDRVTF